MEIIIISILIVAIIVGIAINIWVARFQVTCQTYPLYYKHTNKGQNKMAPTYLFDIGITIIGIGFVIGMLSLFIQYIITKVSK